MGMVLLISIGLSAGIIARLLFLQNAPGGWLLPPLLGAAGAAFAGVVIRWLGGAQEVNSTPELAAAIMGAVWLLLGFRIDVARSRSPHDHPQCRR